MTGGYPLVGKETVRLIGSGSQIMFSSKHAYQRVIGGTGDQLQKIDERCLIPIIGGFNYCKKLTI